MSAKNYFCPGCHYPLPGVHYSHCQTMQHAAPISLGFAKGRDACVALLDEFIKNGNAYRASENRNYHAELLTAMRALRAEGK